MDWDGLTSTVALKLRSSSGFHLDLWMLRVAGRESLVVAGSALQLDSSSVETSVSENVRFLRFCGCDVHHLFKGPTMGARRKNKE
mgnify:CR=1 FL=1